MVTDDVLVCVWFCQELSCKCQWAMESCDYGPRHSWRFVVVSVRTFVLGRLAVPKALEI